MKPKIKELLAVSTSGVKIFAGEKYKIPEWPDDKWFVPEKRTYVKNVVTSRIFLAGKKFTGNNEYFTKVTIDISCNVLVPLDIEIDDNGWYSDVNEEGLKKFNLVDGEIYLLTDSSDNVLPAYYFETGNGFVNMDNTSYINPIAIRRLPERYVPKK